MHPRFSSIELSVPVKDIEETVRFYNVLFGCTPMEHNTGYVRYKAGSVSFVFVSLETKTKDYPFLPAFSFYVSSANEYSQLWEMFKEYKLRDYRETITLPAMMFTINDPDGYAWTIQWMDEKLKNNKPLIVPRITSAWDILGRR